MNIIKEVQGVPLTNKGRKKKSAASPPKPNQNRTETHPPKQTTTTETSHTKTTLHIHAPTSKNRQPKQHNKSQIGNLDKEKQQRRTQLQRRVLTCYPSNTRNND
ncbi:hypothetical protein Ancab_039724 [Ancistrocladus abbreviatus]